MYSKDMENNFPSREKGKKMYKKNIYNSRDIVPLLKMFFFSAGRSGNQQL